MATALNTPDPSWNAFRVTTFAGQHDSHIDTGEDYRTITLASVFTGKPLAKSKMAGDAILASSYNDHDARSHEAQRQRGSFVALVGDIDKGDLSLPTIREAVEIFSDGAAWLIYSSAHSRDGDQRWRLIFPLHAACAYDQWVDGQDALFTFMESRGIPMDHALSRAGQPIYLPNVPLAYKDGTPLRDEAGEPIYYQSVHSGLDAPGLDLSRGIVAGGIAAIRQKRAADDREREALKAEAARRFASKPRQDGAGIIETFNASTSVETMLTLCDYQQSPRNGDDWRSPQQTGDTYATRVIDGKWISLSASDAASGLGSKCKTGCFGDAYDLYVHYKHAGDHKEAYRTLGREQRGANVVQGNFRGEDQDPGYWDLPEWADTGRGEPDYEVAIGGEPAAPEKIVSATPFAWRATADIPKRRWLYGKHLLRGFVSVDVAAGGVGKSSLKIGEALAMATGRDLYDKGLHEGALSVWLWNLEDPVEEIERRLHATAQRFKIHPQEVGNRLYVDSGRDQPLVIATEGPDGAMIARPVVDSLIAEMQDRKIDVLVVDPFISSHAVSENDNNAIDIVAREWNIIAERTGAAINLVHHVRKQNGAEATADSARGASSLIGKARSVLVYNRMSDEEAARLNVPAADRFFHFRVDNDKANLAPAERGDWYRMNNVDLANGDSVGVACSWTPPDAFDGVTTAHLIQMQRSISEGKWRKDQQAKAWAGHALAPILGLDFGEKRDKARAKQIIENWVREGVLEVVIDHDEKRNEREFIIVGRWVSE